MRKEVKPGLYRHYKGHLYQVLGVAKHSETMEDLVVYEARYQNPKSKLWVRPVTMFLETVEVNGKKQPRFQYLEDGKKANVGVGVVIERGGKVLLMKRTGSHGEGTWSCPGGHIDFGETPEQTAIRETKEEVGLDVADPKFLGITNDCDTTEQFNKHYITIWMQAEYQGREPRIASERESTEVSWFSWDNLPSPLFLPLQNFVRGRLYKTVEKDEFVRART